MKSNDDRYQRVITPEDIIIPEGFAMLEVIEKDKPLIITPEQSDNKYNIDYMYVLRINAGEDCRVREKDIVLEFDSFNMSSFESNKRLFTIIPINGIRTAVRPDNYTFKVKTNLN